MAKIRKKIWPDMFEAAKKWNAHVRLADFEIKPGDTIEFAEWDSKKKKFTGRKFSRTVRRVTRLDLGKYYRMADVKKHGIFVIETA